MYGISTVDRLPVEPSLAALCDSGAIELFESGPLDALSGALCGLIKNDGGKS